MPNATYDVLIVGGGVAGLTAGIFTARHGFDTVVVSADSPLLARNAHLENYPGFPAGVNPRLLLDMMRDQAERAGCAFREGEVVAVEREGDGFLVETAGGDAYRTAYVVAATKNTAGFLEGLEGVEIIDDPRTFVEVDGRGRTGEPGVYAAGRLARKPHQTVVAAGHGAEVAVTLVEDSDAPFYHDWVAPDRYFTGRGREIPPGCEEIGREERRRRERESMEFMREQFAEPHPDEPEQHPSVSEADRA